MPAFVYSRSCGRESAANILQGQDSKASLTAENAENTESHANSANSRQLLPRQTVSPVLSSIRVMRVSKLKGCFSVLIVLFAVKSQRSSAVKVSRVVTNAATGKPQGIFTAENAWNAQNTRSYTNSADSHQLLPRKTVSPVLATIRLIRVSKTVLLCSLYSLRLNRVSVYQRLESAAL